MERQAPSCLQFVPLALMSITFVWMYYFATTSGIYCGNVGLGYCEKKLEYSNFFLYFFHFEGLVTLIFFILCGLFIKPRKWGISISIVVYIFLLMFSTLLHFYNEPIGTSDSPEPRYLEPASEAEGNPNVF